MGQRAQQLIDEDVKVIKAQNDLKQLMNKRMQKKVGHVVTKIGMSWIHKENLRRFWSWRGLMVPGKRIARRRLGLITKVQAIVRPQWLPFASKYSFNRSFAPSTF